MFKVGDKVRIKAGWCSHPAEAKRVYTVEEVNEHANVCDLSITLPGYDRPFRSLVGFHMIEKAE